MSADPTVETYPLLFAVVKQHVDYYRDAGEYVSKAHIAHDLQKDSQFTALLEESGIKPGHANALRTFRRVLWQVARYYMKPSTGWWSRSRGRNAPFFHDSWGTPEDCRDALNCLLSDREKDAATVNRLYAITETKCGQLGWSFDPQYAENGNLTHVDVWAYETA